MPVESTGNTIIYMFISLFFFSYYPVIIAVIIAVISQSQEVADKVSHSA